MTEYAPLYFGPEWGSIKTKRVAPKKTLKSRIECESNATKGEEFCKIHEVNRSGGFFSSIKPRREYGLSRSGSKIQCLETG